MNILKRTLAGLLVVFLAFGQVTSIPGTVDAVMGFSNLTIVGAIPYVSATGTLTQNASALFWNNATAQLRIGSATAPDSNAGILVKASSPIITTQTTSGTGNTSWNIYNSGGSVVAQMQYDHTNGKWLFNSAAPVGIGPSNTSPDSTLKVFDATPTTGDTVLKIRDGVAAGARINFSPYSSTTPDAGIQHISTNNLAITNGSSTTYATIGAGGIQFGADNTYPIGASGSGRPSALFVAGTGTFGGNLSAGVIVSSGGLSPTTAARTFISSPADGNLLLANAAASTFDRLQFGGTTSSFVAAKRFGNALAIRAADDTVPTFATLTTCAAGGEGALSPVSDSTTAVWGATITGGGTDHVLAYCNGTNWTVAAK